MAEETSENTQQNTTKETTLLTGEITACVRRNAFFGDALRDGRLTIHTDGISWVICSTYVEIPKILTMTGGLMRMMWNWVAYDLRYISMSVSPFECYPIEQCPYLDRVMQERTGHPQGEVWGVYLTLDMSRWDELFHEVSVV